MAGRSSPPAFLRGPRARPLEFRVGEMVYAAFSRDETIMGFAFPREEREALVSSEPHKFLMPEPSERAEFGAGHSAFVPGSPSVRAASHAGHGTAGLGSGVMPRSARTRAKPSWSVGIARGSPCMIS
jgi:hypothetical protein